MSKSIIELVAEIVSGQSSQRTLSGEEITSLVNDTYHALKRIERLEQGEIGLPDDSQADNRFMEADQERANISPAIDPRDSIRDNEIVCLECGRAYRQITHTHLRREHGLSPEEYRRKHSISAQQPLAARSVTVRRKTFAREQNIGEKLKAARAVSRSEKPARTTDDSKESQ
ncbi:MAG: MucR family transcriptional regulator [Syntrophobacteraceae bacterium]